MLLLIMLLSDARVPLKVVSSGDQSRVVHSMGSCRCQVCPVTAVTRSPRKYPILPFAGLPNVVVIGWKPCAILTMVLRLLTVANKAIGSVGWRRFLATARAKLSLPFFMILSQRKI